MSPTLYFDLVLKRNVDKISDGVTCFLQLNEQSWLHLFCLDTGVAISAFRFLSLYNYKAFSELLSITRNRFYLVKESLRP